MNWKTSIGGLLVGAGLIVGFHSTFSPEPIEVRYERAQNQTVLLRDEHGGSASGFIIERHGPRGTRRVFIWTAAHVVSNAPDQEVIRFYHFDGHKAGQTIFKARVVAFSPKHDLALLLVDAPPGFFPSVTFAVQPARLGDPVFVVGNAFGASHDGSVTSGTVVQRGVRPENGWPWQIDLDQTTAIIVPGNSGGPVFNAGGHVVGVAVGWARMPGIGFYVPLKTIEEWAEHAGIIWAMRGEWCPSDRLLEEAIDKARRELSPPPAPPNPPINSLPLVP